MPRSDPFDTPGFGTGDTFNSGTIDSGSAVPIARSNSIKGGKQEVATIALRDAIPGAALPRDDPAQFRQEGMIVYVQDSDGGGTPENYQLQGGITNAHWVVFSAGGGGGSPGSLALINNTGVAIPEGSIVARSSVLGAAQSPIEVVPCDVSVITALASIPLAVVDAAGGLAAPADSTGSGQGWGLFPMRFAAGLTLVQQEEVIMSAVPGEVTNLGALASGIPAGGSIQRIGVLVHPLSYDGGADRLALVLFLPTQRREQI